MTAAVGKHACLEVYACCQFSFDAEGEGTRKQTGSGKKPPENVKGSCQKILNCTRFAVPECRKPTETYTLNVDWSKQKT